MYQRVNWTAIDDAEDLDLVMSIYTFLEYSSNYSDMAGSLWFYSKDEVTDPNNYTTDTNDFKSFKCKAKLLGNTGADGANRSLRQTTTAMPPKYFLEITWNIID